MEPVVVSIAFFATIFGIFYLLITSSHKEKMSALDKGVDASFFLKKQNAQKSRSVPFWLLRIGVAFVGLSLGLLIGNLLDKTTQLEDPICYFSSIFLCLGGSLIFYFFYEKKELEKQRKLEE